MKCVVIFVLCGILHSGEWIARYNGPGDADDIPKAIVVDGTGNVYVTGVSWNSGTDWDYATMKYSPNGNILWIHRYDGLNNYWDIATAIAIDDAGNVYVTGRSYGTFFDYATIKYKPVGDTAWVRRYNGPGNGSDMAWAIAVDATGCVYVTGRSIGRGTFSDYTTIKYNPNGDIAWVKEYNGLSNGSDVAYAIAVDNAGNVYVTGESWGTELDYLTIKYDRLGDTLWTRRYNGPGNGDDVAKAIVVDGAGNVYVTGESWEINFDYATIKYKPNGDIAWIRRYNGPGNRNDIPHKIAIDGDGNVYVTGQSYGVGSSYDYTTIKYNSAGDELWVRNYNGPNNSYDYAYAIAVDNQSNVYVAGVSEGDYVTIKYNSAGEKQWIRKYNGPSNGSDEALAIAVDNNYVYVTGWSWNSGTGCDYVTIKYSAAGVEERIPKTDHRLPSLEIYPNPAIGSAIISYELLTKTNISICVYDLSGRLVKNVYSGIKEKGKYEANIELPSGIYFIKLDTHNITSIKKITILR